MKIHAHLVYNYTPELITQLRDLLHPAIELTVGKDMGASSNYHILITGDPTREQLNASPKLHTLIIPWTGISKETVKLMLEFPHINVHNMHHHAASNAELAVTLLLAAAKAVLPYDQALRQNNWSLRYQGPGRALGLAGKTALVLGYGHIGKRVARICRALDMTVWAIKRHVTDASDEWAHEIHPTEALHALLPRANALIICLPLTSETEALIGTAEFNLLPPQAVLVNIGRGLIVDQAALYEALRDGRLHSAGLDVWYNYPPDKASRSHTPPADFPFHELDNVVMSPHRGSDTESSEAARMPHLARLLNAAARGEPVPNQMDLNAGY